MGRRSKQSKEEIAEECCFACKDGGNLRVCDFKNCLKAYHPQCVGKDEEFLNSDEQFICNWHVCFICQRSSYYQCFCCPNYSVCRGCIKQAEFVQVRKHTKGFCNNCLRLAILIEKNVDVDSDEERVDFRDKETYEFLFKDYWEVIKDKEGLTLVDLHEANVLLKRGLNHKEGSDLAKFPDEEYNSDEDFLGGDDDYYDGDEEPKSRFDSKGKSKKVKASFKKGKSNRKAYVGWGSKELIEFLLFIGKDTSRPLDQFGIAEVVKEYIQQKNLFQQDKKKKYVICDDKLWSLFRKRKLKYNKLHNLLETHIAANATSEDESLDSSEDDDDSITKKKPRTSFEAKIPKRVSERNKRCFAALVGDNVKLIYLKRSLVVDLLKHPQTFEQKVVGCFVRVKNDHKVYGYQMYQKLYLLGQVTGIKKSPEEYKIRDTCTDILLCVSNMWAEVQISMLSDEDFDEEECEDLRLLFKKESFKRPTVAGLEEKVRSVHRDIVNHRIDKELLRLEKLIEIANEKGWRQDMHEYIDRRQLLRTPVERQRLLEEIPQVIPDKEEELKDIELEIAAGNSFEENGGSPAQGIGTSIAIEDAPHGAAVQVADSSKAVNEESTEGASKQDIAACKVASQDIIADSNGDNPSLHVEKPDTSYDDNPGLHDQKRNTEDGGRTQVYIIKDEDDAMHKNGGDMPIIDLDADDGDCHMEQQEATPVVGKETINGTVVIPEYAILWHYSDPQGDVQGPFPMILLQKWKETGYFDENFKVWTAGQTKENAILLKDAMRDCDTIVKSLARNGLI